MVAMTLLSSAAFRKRATWWLMIGSGLSIVVVLWIGGSAVRQSRRNAQLLAERRADEAANLLASALIRDMQGVQQSVLLSAEWDQFMLDSPYDIETLIASAFARYPYPESFFAWRRLPLERTPVFFSRRDRPPVWMEPDASPNRFPVAVTVDAPIGTPICDRIRLDAARGRRFSVFTTEVQCPVSGGGTAATRMHFVNSLRPCSDSWSIFTGMSALFFGVCRADGAAGPVGERRHICDSRRPRSAGREHTRRQ
jgi:hypothetical protein